MELLAKIRDKVFTFFDPAYSVRYEISQVSYQNMVDQIQKENLFRYYCIVSFENLEYVYNRIRFKIKDSKYYLLNRFWYKSHLVDTKLPKGAFHEFHNKVLHATFNELVDFVEIEKAHWYLWCEPDHQLSTINKFKRWAGFRVRSPELGIRALEEERNLVNEMPGTQSAHQAKIATEILELYDWWVNVRPGRDAIYEMLDERFDQLKTVKQRQKYIKKMSYMSKTYNNEDKRMMGRVIKIMECIWT